MRIVLIMGHVGGNRRRARAKVENSHGMKYANNDSAVQVMAR